MPVQIKIFEGEEKPDVEKQANEFMKSKNIFKVVSVKYDRIILEKNDKTSWSVLIIYRTGLGNQ